MLACNLVCTKYVLKSAFVKLVEWTERISLLSFSSRFPDLAQAFQAWHPFRSALDLEL